MTRLLCEAAEIREARERVRLDEDALSARRETSALLAAIRMHGRSTVKHHVSRSAPRRAAATARVTP